MDDQLRLDLDVPSAFVVHCMFCSTTVRCGDPVVAHDDMERHYAARHQRQLDRIVGTLR